MFDAARLEKQYDIVLFNAVLEHVVDPVSFLKQLNAAMKPDGSLFVLTPNADSLSYRWLKSWWRELLSIGEHIYLFTPGSLELCAEQAGLRLVRYASDFDHASLRIRSTSPRELAIGLWWIYREIVKRLSRAVCTSATGDILYAHLKKEIPSLVAG